jgi:hypothetical protein
VTDAVLKKQDLWYGEQVKRPSALRFVFAALALALAGLLLTPVAVPAMPAAAVMGESMGDHAAMAMPADMPCCPDQAPMPDCGKNCPFMASCAAQFVYDLPHGAGIVAPPALASLVVPGNDAGLTGLTQRPPPRPPKI